MGENNNIKLALKCAKSNSITKGHGNFLFFIDTEALKYGYQSGFETLVVHTLNDEYYILFCI